MKPKSTSNELNQNELFRNRLDQILNSKRPLYQISKKTDWGKFEKAFVQYYMEKKEDPGYATLTWDAKIRYYVGIIKGVGRIYQQTFIGSLCLK